MLSEASPADMVLLKPLISQREKRDVRETIQ